MNTRIEETKYLLLVGVLALASGGYSAAQTSAVPNAALQLRAEEVEVAVWTEQPAPNDEEFASIRARDGSRIPVKSSRNLKMAEKSSWLADRG